MYYRNYAQNMKKIIHGNLIGFVVLVILPWYVANKEYYWNILPFDANYLFISALVGAACLVCVDIVIFVKTKGRERKAALFFAIPPFLLVTFFVLAYFFAFSGFTGF